MTAHVSPDAPRPLSGIRDSGGPMPFNEADFTRTAAELVAEGDRVPTQRQDGCVMTMTLADFLLARIAEDEAAARDLTRWTTFEMPFHRLYDDDPEVQADFDAKDHAKTLAQLLATHGIPARALAECEAKRRIVALHSEDEEGGGLHVCHDSLADETECGELRALAGVYADHPDFP